MRAEIAPQVGTDSHGWEAGRVNAWATVVLSFVVAVAAPRLVARGSEPANLLPHKQEIRRYVESGEYARTVREVAEEAKAWLRERVRRAEVEGKKERLAVVFDVDETLLDNTAHMLAQDFGYVPPVWFAWVEEGRIPAMGPVREVYALARELGVAVVIVTGRPERLRAATEKNLRAIGCTEIAKVMMRPEGAKETSAAMKFAQRQQLAAEGFVIIANLGDQRSDFAGGGAERDFKLPNPFYLTE